MHHSGFAMMTVPTRRAEHGMKDSVMANDRRRAVYGVVGIRKCRCMGGALERPEARHGDSFLVVQELSAATDLPAHGVGLTSLAEANQGPRT